MTQLHDTDRDFLQDLGRRVCTARMLRRWSRRTLAVMSGISERYIAQLEAGKGNISILLLCRISRAMTVPLTDILPSGASMEQDRHAPFHPGQ
jgi:XRE family aerobic/anaerobic benzoate catabolism transcriptional regulator